jgi:glycerol-3-phosphate dehydrogenase
VAAFAAGQIQHPGAGTEPMTVPQKPRAGPSDPGDGGHGHGRLSSQRATLDRLAAEPADLLVIGGGITGAGVARDAAMRGLRTVLVEQNDLGSGTSSRSSRLIHGGLRYLETGDLRLVLEANRERRVLLRIAPHLVWPLPFLFPLHRGDRLSLWRLAAGMWLYDLLASFRNVKMHRMLGKRAVLEAEPMLRERGLRGGARFYDAQCDDSRLVLATARSAMGHGALVANYMAARSLERTAGRVTGAEIEDRLTGERATVRASVVVNATGPWADRLRVMEDTGAAPLLRPTKGIHIVVDRSRLDHRDGIIFLSPIDGRVLFILPWRDLSYIGTTDTDTAESPERLTVTMEEVVYLLRSANARFPSARLGLEDVRGGWAGLRPLLAANSAVPESGRSREHAIVQGSGGMISVVGGKLTTYRVMAREVVDRAVRELRLREGRPRVTDADTDEEPLPGGETDDFSEFKARGLELGVVPESVEHLIRHYGTEAAGIYNLGAADRRLLRRLVPPHPAIEAEVLHAVRRELAQTVEDVMVRRTHLYYEHPERGLPAAGRVAELMGGELGWDVERIAAEARRYVEFARP